MTKGISEFPAQTLAVQGEDMLQPDEVAAMVRLHELGWGAKRLAREFGCARNTVRRYLRAGGTVPSRSRSVKQRSMGSTIGCGSASSGMEVTPMLYGRSWPANMGS